MEVTKVKVLDSGTTVEYVTTNVNTPEAHALRDCPDARRPEFVEAMESVQADARGILGLGKTIGDRWHLTGVSVSKNANGHRGYIFTGKLTTNAGAVALNSPLMREAVDEETGTNTLSDVALKRVRAMLELAVAYASGQREQGELALGAAGIEEAQPSAAVN